jgi:hypothetical protein
MIDKATLKKHNLKAVPFSCIGEGQTFLCMTSYDTTLIDNEFNKYCRHFVGDKVYLANGWPSCFNRQAFIGHTVYVPVWRPCRKTHLLEEWGYKPIQL